ncbi:MAG TPA: type IV pilus biogenesis/stability protein PilW [Gammaproteobacteria bacterium]|nr:type IV pilus biogenesis/stability protein PilW [Gammaproteobacteria bacterium]
MKHLAYGLVLILVLAACTTTRPAVDLDKAAEINAQLGSGYLAQGDLDLAKMKFEKALKQDPGLSAAHSGYALLMSRLGEMGKAQKHFKKALSLDPNDSGTLNNYGIFLCSQNKFKEADKQFMAALRDPLYKTPEFAYTNAGRCSLKNKDEAQAEAYFGKALQANPKFPDALFEMANLQYTKRKYAQAQANLQKFERYANHTPASLWLAVRVARSLGRRNEEASYSLLLKNKFPDSEEAAFLRGTK